VLNDDAAHSELGAHSSNFWIMVAALKAFVVGGWVMPVLRRAVVCVEVDVCL